MNLPNLIVAPELLYECKSRDLEFAAPKIWVQAFIPPQSFYPYFRDLREQPD